MKTTPVQFTQGMYTSIPILAAMQVRVVHADPGHAVAELPFEPNSNHFGAIYAGSLYTAAEVLGGAISRATFDLDDMLAGFVTLLKSSEMTYRRPALGRVRARAWIKEEDFERVPRDALAEGKADFVLQAELVDDDDTQLATFRGVYQLRRM